MILSVWLLTMKATRRNNSKAEYQHSNSSHHWKLLSGIIYMTGAVNQDFCEFTVVGRLQAKSKTKFLIIQAWFQTSVFFLFFFLLFCVCGGIIALEKSVPSLKRINSLFDFEHMPFLLFQNQWNNEKRVEIDLVRAKYVHLWLPLQTPSWKRH